MTKEEIALLKEVLASTMLMKSLRTCATKAGKSFQKLLKSMKPISEVKLLDCMEGMRQYPDKYFELAIVDPPYGILASKINHYQSQTRDKITNYKAKEWDFERPKIEYFLELFRVSKNQMIWGGNFFSETLPPSKDWIFWDKEQPFDMHFSQGEMCWCSFGKGIKIFKHSIAKDQNRVSNNRQLALNYCRIHPTQKPVSLYEWLLRNYAKPGDKILDTHLGSGSSRIAAYKMGFDFYGFEIDQDYFNASEKRFKEAIAMPLFDAQPIAQQAVMQL